MKIKGLLLLFVALIVLANSQQDPNCVKQTSPGNCAECADMFFPWNGLCTEVNPACDTYDHSDGSCLTCKPNLTLISGMCLTADEASSMNDMMGQAGGQSDSGSSSSQSSQSSSSSSRSSFSSSSGSSSSGRSGSNGGFVAMPMSVSGSNGDSQGSSLQDYSGDAQGSSQG